MRQLANGGAANHLVMPKLRTPRARPRGLLAGRSALRSTTQDRARASADRTRPQRHESTPLALGVGDHDSDYVDTMVIPRVDVSVSMFAGTIVDMLGVVSSSIPIVDVRDTIGKAAQND
jgi:hypothetical protein